MLLAVCWTSICWTSAAHAQQEPTVQPLRILYAGKLDHPRAAEFMDFLKTRFQSVKAVPFEKLSTQAAADSDVVVVDLPNTDLSTVRYIDLPKDFTRPTVLVGVNGSRLGGKYTLKITDG
jgi:hypothetical protein